MGVHLCATRYALTARARILSGRASAMAISSAWSAAAYTVVWVCIFPLCVPSRWTPGRTSRSSSCRKGAMTSSTASWRPGGCPSRPGSRRSTTPQRLSSTRRGEHGLGRCGVQHIRISIIHVSLMPVELRALLLWPLTLISVDFGFRLRAVVEGREPPTELPRRAPAPAPAHGSGHGGHNDRASIQPIPGESEADVRHSRGACE